MSIGDTRHLCHVQGVIAQVRGRGDSMSTPQNGAAAYSQSHISRVCKGGFPLPHGIRLSECPSPMVVPL